jgi:RHS repeat-associated protein
VGRLTGASDANHSMSWSYDALGRVTSKGQTIGTVTKTVGYGYTNGNLTSITTPSGQNVGYGYNSNHQVTSITINGATLLSSVLYDPFGPVRGWTWGNTTLAVRTYDQDGKITQVDSGGLKTYAYDDAFRITGITDTVVPANSWTYGYDALDRITSGIATSTTRGWIYDANGNRLTETGSSPTTYTISSTNNRITSTTGSLARTYGYDAAGNVLTYATVTATYNNRGRMKTLKKGSSTETIVWNALGQRVKVSGGTPGTVLYVYDESGHLLGEYTSTGALVEETVWMGDIPVATIRPGTPAVVYYVHTDHLNTPRRVSRPSDNKLMWTWYSDPFGTDLPNENPAGGGTFKYNLRFSGQLYDSQAGLSQNYFRDYDPAIGRYVESDPIGLKGGNNTYAYVAGSPVSAIDPLGLAKMCCRLLNSTIVGSWVRKRHCYIKADDGTVYGLYPKTIAFDYSLGIPRKNDPRDQGGQCFDCPGKDCENQSACLKKAAESYPVAEYVTLGANSNTFAGTLARSCCKGGIPAGVHDAPSVASPTPPPAINAIF